MSEKTGPPNEQAPRDPSGAKPAGGVALGGFARPPAGPTETLTRN